MAFQKMATLIWRVAWVTLPLALLGYLAFGFHMNPPVSDNPMRPKTWQEAKRQDKVAEEERAQRKFWIEQIESGGMSFEEAGCGYRGGEWQYNANHCDTESISRLP